MATRAVINLFEISKHDMIEAAGRQHLASVYQHWDGYPEHRGVEIAKTVLSWYGYSGQRVLHYLQTVTEEDMATRLARYRGEEPEHESTLSPAGDIVPHGEQMGQEYEYDVYFCTQHEDGYTYEPSEDVDWRLNGLVIIEIFATSWKDRRDRKRIFRGHPTEILEQYEKEADQDD